MTTTDPIPQAPNVRLVPHPTARNAAVATSQIRAGSVIASIPSLSTCLLPSEKGKRCDECHTSQTEHVRLRKCSGCASFWYCGATCQERAWKAHHKKLCKSFNAYAVSPAYQALTAHDQADAMLLSQMLSQTASWEMHGTSGGYDDPYATFLDLLKGPRADGYELPLCLPRAGATAEATALAKELYSRFGNNNFVLHSHLNSYGHGVFPLASRLFNHSCVPNAVCKYIIRPEKSVMMQVVALREIAEGEEIIVPYLDPALPYQTRQDALLANYGFGCRCRLCAFQRGIGPVTPPAGRGTKEFRDMEAALHAFALRSNDGRTFRIPDVPGLFESTPARLCSAFHKTYLPTVAELFSKTSHEGPFADALESGLTLLAFYVLVYPPNYPQIGMHALELSKTVWNLVCTAGSNMSAAEAEALERQATAFLDIAATVMENFGQEGDEGGPLEEIRILGDMLKVA
ncbi:SET domain-containing protein [Trametes punicea]|nr:SET domain-containing protein [Trametes punicea]